MEETMGDFGWLLFAASILVWWCAIDSKGPYASPIYRGMFWLAIVVLWVQFALWVTGLI